MARASILLLVFVVGCGPTLAPESPTFEGTSDELQKSQIVATLDSPIEPGQTTIWCASFQIGWKAIEEYVGGPVKLEDSPSLAAELSAAPSLQESVPEDALLVEAGTVKDGVLARIDSQLTSRFPQALRPEFPPLTEDSLVAYAYLKANVRFTVPYCQNTYPLEFTDSAGRVTEVHSLGMGEEDEPGLVAQPRVLFRTGSPEGPDFEFAIDLCRTSKTSRIVVARIKPEKTLQAAFARVGREESSYTGPDGIEPHDFLAVPDMCWRLVHRFAELEGKKVLNSGLNEQLLEVARQGIAFRLDYRGADLESEAVLTATTSSIVPTQFVLDRPYLVFMQKRGSRSPYFAMWVDNAELLSPWTAKR
jgi:hypothetical protein